MALEVAVVHTAMACVLSLHTWTTLVMWWSALFIFFLLELVQACCHFSWSSLGQSVSFAHCIIMCSFLVIVQETLLGGNSIINTCTGVALDLLMVPGYQGWGNDSKRNDILLQRLSFKWWCKLLKFYGKPVNLWDYVLFTPAGKMPPWRKVWF